MRGFLTSVLLAVLAGLVLAQVCPEGEQYKDCGGCEPTCDTVGTVQLCAAVCRQGCYCPHGLVRSSEGKCIDKLECTITGNSGVECDPNDPDCDKYSDSNADSDSDSDSDSDCEFDETDPEGRRAFGRTGGRRIPGRRGKPCFPKRHEGKRPDRVRPTGKPRPVDPQEPRTGDKHVPRTRPDGGKPHRTRPEEPSEESRGRGGHRTRPEEEPSEEPNHHRTRPEEPRQHRTRPDGGKPPRTSPEEEPSEEPRGRGGHRTRPVPGDNGGRRRPEEGASPPPRRGPQ